MIKRATILTALLLSISLQGHADVGAFFGISCTFGEMKDIGLTVKVLSDDEEDKFVAAAGVSFYPMSDDLKFGVDISGGYLFKNVAATIGWDILQRKPQLSLGYVDTDDGSSGASTTSSPAAPSSPPPVTPPITPPVSPPPSPPDTGTDL